MFFKKRWMQAVLFIGSIGVSIGMLLFVVTCTVIGYDVKEQCRDAQQAYGGDCVDALINLLDDDKQSFTARNSAIWALGQLGDERALPVLEKYFSGYEKGREPLEAAISQYSLNKAINLINGINLTAWAWR